MGLARRQVLSLKRRILEICSLAKEGHIPSAFSILDILYVLYDRILRISPERPHADDRDYFILSKGHASLALYSVLSSKGFFPATWLETFGKKLSPLGGHPDTSKVPGVEASTGSLGHGLPYAVGIALGCKIRDTKQTVYTLIGDGEANEGTIWESALLAAHHKLNNLCLMVDYNHSSDRALCLGDLSKKFEAFGWSSHSIDGHDHREIEEALLNRSDRPTVIIAETIKGKGLSSMEQNPAWHHRSPTPEELSQLLLELES